MAKRWRRSGPLTNRRVREAFQGHYRKVVPFFAAFLICISVPAKAQDALGWNSSQALDLIHRARDRRELPQNDTSLQNYQSKANGFVYFYLDRIDSDERTLVKVDQIALDLYWKRPNLTKQRIVGMRNVSRLPNKMYYHLDHLTVVQNGFGDVIRIGDGDEVRDVPHPAAPGADSIYDYRLADSVTLQLGGQGEVRVYELNVRPKRTNRSALVGSVFVDRGSADIVRMTFTFTPVSYVDKRLDYINISLDNGLFGGKYWLPNEQSIEIRRQIPELDFVAGSVIKGHIRVANYAFNEPISDSIFYGLPVIAAPPDELKKYPFPADIYADLREAGLAPPPQLQDLRAQAAKLLREKRLSGLPPWRLYVPNASSVIRHDSAEGWYGGLGVTYAPSPSFRVNALGGYALGAKRGEASIGLEYRSNDSHTSLRAYYNEPRDIGTIAGMPGALNTITSAFGGTDYTDLYFTRGAALAHGQSLGSWTLGEIVSLEKHVASARAVYRTEEGVHAGTFLQAGLSFERKPSDQSKVTWGANGTASLVHYSGAPGLHTPMSGELSFFRLTGTTTLNESSADKRTTFASRLYVGFNSTPDVPPQMDFLIGGRETLPGYGYRQFEAPAFWAANGELARTLWYPWLRARVLGYAAYTGTLQSPGVQVDLIPAANFDLVTEDFDHTDNHLRASAGAGVGLLWDAIHIDVVKGARWQTLFSIRHDFWDLL